MDQLSIGADEILVPVAHFQKELFNTFGTPFYIKVKIVSKPQGCFFQFSFRQCLVVSLFAFTGDSNCLEKMLRSLNFWKLMFGFVLFLVVWLGQTP